MPNPRAICRVLLAIGALAVTADGDDTPPTKARTKQVTNVKPSPVSLKQVSVRVAEEPDLRPDPIELPPVQPPPMLNFPQAYCPTNVDCEDCQYRCGRRGCPCQSANGCVATNSLKLRLMESHWGYCNEFCERPLGQAVFAHLNVQTFNGLAQQMVLYTYDFNNEPGPEKNQLNTRGLYQLHKMVQRLQQGMSWIVVASSDGAPEIDQARKESVEQHLEKLGIPFTPDQIVVRRIPKPMLHGNHAQLIQGNHDSLIRNSGNFGVSTLPTRERIR